MCLCLGVGQVHALDTGHHADLTVSSMTSLGFQVTPARVAQLENWLVDYYSNQPLVGLEDDLAKLHFDNLVTPDEIKAYWGHLVNNSKGAFEKAATDGDALHVVALLGMSLHAVQDFYSHSNWVEEHMLSDTGYLTDTYFDNPIVAAFPTLRTGRYPNSNPLKPTDHGDGQPSTAGMNHDAYARPRWNQAYVFAFCASRQWVQAAEGWVKGVSGGDTVWANAKALTLSASDMTDLNNDLEASYRLSEYAPGGHWKGIGSEHTSEFVPAAAAFAASSDSIFVDHFKEDKWHKALTDGLENTTIPSSVAAMPIVSHPFVAVSVRTLAVQELPVGVLESKIDVGGKADFYAKVRVGDVWHIESMQLDKSSVSLHWDTLAFVPEATGSVVIRYELWDEDGGIAGGDDQCDIYHKTGERAIAVTMDLNTEVLSGDFTGVHNLPSTAITSGGQTPDKDRAEVKLVFSRRPLIP